MRSHRSRHSRGGVTNSSKTFNNIVEYDNTSLIKYVITWYSIWYTILCWIIYLSLRRPSSSEEGFFAYLIFSYIIMYRCVCQFISYYQFGCFFPEGHRVRKRARCRLGDPTAFAPPDFERKARRVAECSMVQYSIVQYSNSIVKYSNSRV